MSGTWGRTSSGRLSRGGLAGLVCAGALVLASGQAWARQEGQKPSDDAVLKGPEVRDNSLPGSRGKFSGGTAGPKEKKKMDQGVPPQVLLRAVAVLKSDSVPEADRLTSDQESKIRSVQEDFRTKQKAFFEEHRDEIMKLRSELSPENQRKVDERLRAIPGFGREGPAGRPERRSPKGKPEAKNGDEMQQGKEASGSEQTAALAKLKELAEKAPDPKDAQTRAWAVLSDSQKVLVEKELQRLRKEGRPGEAGAEGRLPEGLIGADGKVDMSKLPPRLRERFEKMTPEEREKAIQRLKERGVEHGKGKGKDAEDGEKEAPSMDDVKVPAPR